MRIISGKYKGKKIDFLKNSITRPLKDSVRENIFNILQHSNKFNLQIEKSKILDLYSGVGSFGLECLSRGAKQVTFVEENELALEKLSKNITNFSISHKVEINKAKITDFIISNKKKFQIFFFDPPFKDQNFLFVLKMIREKKIYESNHILIIHREKNSFQNFNKYFNTEISRKYGRSEIFFGTFS